MATSAEDVNSGEQPVAGLPPEITGAGPAAQEALQDACPALGFTEDEGSHYLLPTEQHRCFAGAKKRPVPLEYQRQLCLSPEHVRCPFWIAAEGGGPGGTNGAHSAPAPPVVFVRDEDKGLTSHLRLGRRPIMIGLTVGVVTLLAVAAGAYARSRTTTSRGSAAVAAVETPQATAAAGSQAPGPVATPVPRASDIPDAQLLRPGAVLVKRFNASLDGSPTGQAIVASRIPAAGGCDHWYLDV